MIKLALCTVIQSVIIALEACAVVNILMDKLLNVLYGKHFREGRIDWNVAAWAFTIACDYVGRTDINHLFDWILLTDFECDYEGILLKALLYHTDVSFVKSVARGVLDAVMYAGRYIYGNP